MLFERRVGGRGVGVRVAVEGEGEGAGLYIVSILLSDYKGENYEPRKRRKFRRRTVIMFVLLLIT